MTTIAQADLDFGHHFMRPMGPVYDYLMVFGRIPTVPELVAAEILGVTEYASDDAHTKSVDLARQWIDAAQVDTDLHWALRGQLPLEIPLDRMRRSHPHRGDIDDASGLYHVARSWRDGHLFSKAYSEACVDGEYGTTPRQTMIPLTPAEFAEARAVGWDFRHLSDPRAPLHADWAVHLVMMGGDAAYRRTMEV